MAGRHSGEAWKEKHCQKGLRLGWKSHFTCLLLILGGFSSSMTKEDLGWLLSLCPQSTTEVPIFTGKLKCAALVYRTLTRKEPSTPLLQCQFKAKDGNGVNFSVENLIFATQATATTRKPRNSYQKHTMNEK